jgi:hypothetical protein
MDTALLEKEVLSLDRKSRGRLTARLLESLGIHDGLDLVYEGKFDPNLLEELARRSREWDADPSLGRPADEVLLDIRERLNLNIR